MVCDVPSERNTPLECLITPGPRVGHVEHDTQAFRALVVLNERDELILWFATTTQTAGPRLRSPEFSPPLDKQAYSMGRSIRWCIESVTEPHLCLKFGPGASLLLGST